MSGANVDDVFDRVETKVKGLLDENAQLREQNRVLRQALLKVKPELYCMDKQLIASGYKRGASVADAMRSLEAALTATSQPERRCPDCQSPYAQCQAWRAQGKIACCPDCRHDATSQEGQG